MANDERKAVEQAKATLSTLTPTTPRDDAIKAALRHAALLMSDAAAKGMSSEADLNNLRGDAGIALNAVARSFDTGTLTQARIDKARQAVAAVLDQLSAP
jgi:hypothetical protein